MYSNVVQHDESSFVNNFEQLLTHKFKFCNTKSWKKFIEFFQQAFLTWLIQIGKRRNWHSLNTASISPILTWNKSLSKMFDWQMFCAKLLILPNLFDVNRKEIISERWEAVWCLFYWFWTSIWLWSQTYSVSYIKVKATHEPNKN